MSRKKVVTHDPIGLSQFQSTNADVVNMAGIDDDASNIDFVPTDPTAWNPTPTDVSGALNQLPATIPKWKTLYSVDFSTLANLAMVADGVYLIGGKKATKQGSGYGSTIAPNGIYNGKGINLMPNMLNATDPRFANQNRPSLRWNLNDLLGSNWPLSTPLRMTYTMVFDANTLTNNNQWYGGVISQGTANGRFGPLIQPVGGSGGVLLNLSAYAAPDGNYTLSANTNVMYLAMRVWQIFLPLGVQGPAFTRGATGPAIPDPNSIQWTEFGTIDSWSTSAAASVYTTDPTAGSTSKFAIELGGWGMGYENAALVPPYFKSMLVEMMS